jgi:hypothetical protein
MNLGLDPVAKFFVPDNGEKVDSGIRLSYRPARLHRLYVPHSGTLNLATGFALNPDLDPDPGRGFMAKM